MTTHQTAELFGPELDAAVAMAEGHQIEHVRAIGIGSKMTGWYETQEHGSKRRVAPASTDWSIGGPIIEREKMLLMPLVEGFHAVIERPEDYASVQWGWNEIRIEGAVPAPTMLIAAMRAFVASKLGDTVELP
jgi:hypothetical protein